MTEQLLFGIYWVLAPLILAGLGWLAVLLIERQDRIK